MIEKISIDSIPTPDNSGASNTQKSEAEKTLLVQAESPIGMGQVVNGLVAESSSGLNRQSSIFVGAFLDRELKKLEAVEKELRAILPENAVLKEQNKNLQKNNRIGAILNVISTLLFSVGIGILVSIIVSAETNTSISQAVIGGTFIFFGFLLSCIVIFTSLRGSE